MSKNWSFESVITTIACVKAYKNEKIKDAKESLKLGAEPNQVICSIIDWLIENPLITGAQEKFLKLLITKIDIEKIYKNNPIGWYLLNWATSTSAYKIIESILTLNSDTNKLNFGDYNLMCIPIRNGDVELMRLLFKYKINPNSPSYDGSLAISSAISVGRINMLKLLLENGAKTDIKDNWGNTPLDYAVLKGSIEIFRILANDKFHTNLDFKNQDGFSLLHMAFLKSYQSQLIQYLPNNYWDLKNLIKKLKILETPLESWCIFDFFV
jgi:ankyrin repeat protein